MQDKLRRVKKTKKTATRAPQEEKRHQDRGKTWIAMERKAQAAKASQSKPKQAKASQSKSKQAKASQSKPKQAKASQSKPKQDKTEW